MIRKLIIFLFVIILSYNCAASVETQTESISKCSCEKVVDSFVVNNPNDFSVTYLVTNTGTGAPLAKISNKKFVLPPGSQFTFTNTYLSDCGMFGKYETITSIKDNTGNTFGFKKDIMIDQCTNIKASVSGEPSICAGDSSEFKVDITNTANFKDIVKISLAGYKNYSFDKSTFNISKGQTVTRILSINTTDYAYYEPTIIVESIPSKRRIDIPLGFEVENCYDIAFDITDFEECNEYGCQKVEGPVCLGEFKYNLALKNWGTRDQDITISTGVSNLNRVEVIDNLIVEEGELVDLDLIVKTLEAGDASFTIYIGDESRTVNMNFVDDYNCHKPVITKNTIFVLNGSEYFEITLRNNGIESAYYSVIEFSDMIEVDEEFELEPGTSKTIVMKITGDVSYSTHHDAIYIYSNGVEYKEDITLKVTQDYNKMFKDNFVGIMSIVGILTVIFVIVVISTFQDEDDE